ncbi:MAG: type II toxin-antitoxin system RatA family toxin [Sandaracinaceae bacterium]
MHPKTLLSALALALAPALLVTAPALAQPEARPAWDARQAPLRGFSARELTLIAPMLERGTVALVELPHGAVLPAVHLARVVHAPAARIADVVSDPAHYPDFMPAVGEVEVTERAGQSIAFSWRWTTSVFALSGQAMLTRFDAPASHPERGFRIDIQRTQGDLGHGREVWRILPRGPGRSLVLLSTRMDLRDSNYLTQSVASASRSINRSVNIAMATGTLLRAGTEAERRSGYVATPRPAALHAPEVDLAPLANVLRRGDMLLIESNGIQLTQSSVMSRLPQPEARVRQIMLDPVAFTQALIPGSSATVLAERGNARDFHWGVDLPLIGTSGDMTLSEREDRVVELDATDGAMNGGRWRFRSQPLPGNATGVVGWATFDVGDTNFLLRAIVDADPAFRPGLSGAMEVMMARALRIRVNRRD